MRIALLWLFMLVLIAACSAAAYHDYTQVVTRAPTARDRALVCWHQVETGRKLPGECPEL